MTTEDDPIVEIPFRIPPGEVGFVASPGEFARAGRFAGASFDSVRTLPVGDGGRELRLFTLSAGVAMRDDLARVPGYNIRILPAGTEVVVRVLRSMLKPLPGVD